MQKIIGLVCVCFMIVSCTEKNTAIEINNEHVSGVWQAALFESTIPGITPEQQEGGKQEFLSSVYTLHPDHSFELTSNTFAAGAKGRWLLDQNTKELTMTYEMGGERGEEVFTVKRVTADSLTLRIDLTDGVSYLQLVLAREK